MTDADSIPRRNWTGADAVLCSICLLLAAAAAVCGSHMLSYRYGLGNGVPFNARIREGVVMFSCVGVWCVLVCVVGMRVISGWRRMRASVRGALVAAVALPLIVYVGTAAAFSNFRYTRGLQEWARANVNAAAIRALLATDPAPSSPTPVPAATWPPAVVTLLPDQVDRLPAGLVLTWGVTAEFSSRRQVFVGAPEGGPPQQIKWGDEWQDVDEGWWKEAAPGVWVSVQ